MADMIDGDFAWAFFAGTGNIEGYLLYKQLKNSGLGKVCNENDTDNGTGA